MIERARIWWDGRSERERWLLGVMGGLLAVAFVWLGVIRPLDGARVRADQRLDTATRDSGRVTAALHAITAAQRETSAPLTAPLPSIVGADATGAGFTLSRLDAQGTDRIAIGISSARSRALFGWLAGLRKQGIVVERMTLRTNSDATLAVEGVLRARGR